MSDGAFVFDRYTFDAGTGTLSLGYRYENGSAFEEKIVFPPATRTLSADDLTALDNAFRLLFLLAGVSYYKAYAPKQLKCAAFPLDNATATFMETVYRNGLGEFAYQNKLDLSDGIQFVAEDITPVGAVTLSLPHQLLVPVGGGKDSIVSIECLKQNGETPTLFALGNASGIAEPIRATAEVADLPLIEVQRTLSANLMELNKAGALNGHVPITAILSAITVVCAILYGFDTIVMSNEHSASAPNLRVGNLDINHQYSKSFAFEKDFARYVAEHISPSLSYFSLLRPLSEAEIARRFSRLEKYHDVFRSCNTAFKQDAHRRSKNWCGHCPKCRFVFLALAPFTNKQRLTNIFGRDLLADPSQREGFAELCGLAATKPFECVGEIEESALLMEKLFTTAAWKDDVIVQDLGQKLLQNTKNFDKRYEALFVTKPDHRVPEKYLRIIDACR